jgi:hypothetical protein
MPATEVDTTRTSLLSKRRRRRKKVIWFVAEIELIVTVEKRVVVVCRCP